MVQWQYLMNKFIWFIEQLIKIEFFLINNSSLVSLECEGAFVLCDLMLWGGMVNPDGMFKVVI